MTSEKRFFKPPISNLVDALNPIALVGWCYVAVLVATTPAEFLNAAVNQTCFALEAICVVEVARMAVGDLPGNIVLGAVLHAIRLLALAQVLPRTDLAHAWLTTAVLGSWAVTEVSRYPMYVAKGFGPARLLRMVVPMVTFPIGCGAEAYAAWLVFQQGGVSAALKGALVGMLAVNVLLGPTMAYPVVMKKGLEAIGLHKTKDKKVE